MKIGDLYYKIDLIEDVTVIVEAVFTGKNGSWCKFDTGDSIVNVNGEGYWRKSVREAAIAFMAILISGPVCSESRAQRLEPFLPALYELLMVI